MKLKHRWTIFVLGVLILAIMFLSYLFLESFISVKQDIKTQTFNFLLKEVNDFAKNIERYNNHMFGDLKQILTHNKSARDIYDEYLSSFITSNYKNVFIVYKDENSKFFRVLADGSLDPLDRFEFNEKFEPKYYDKWIWVVKHKKPIYFKNDIKDIWTTYLYPVLHKGKLDYIIAIDFSTRPIKYIDDSLITFQKIFVFFTMIVIIIIIVLSIFMFYDFKRQQKMETLLKEVQNLNINLQKRVQEEVKKSREKDKQLILQSRLALMGELLSMIAHQWRQPLNVIGSVVSNMELDLMFNEINEENLKKRIAKIKDTIMYLSNTIEDFRKFYRKDLQKVKVNVNDVIEEIMSLIQPSLMKKNIKIVKKYNCDKDTKISIFKNELKQVILNLLKNSEDILIERKIENPLIEIRTFKENNKCVVEIKDNAGGVDEEIKDKIFEPYFTTKDEKNGTGLGLYMSKMIIEQRLNGKLYEYNDKDGAVFRMEFKVEDGY
jgi:signal transduction histidine kinase